MFLIIDFMLVTYHPVCSQARTKAASFHFHLDVAYTEFFPEDLLPSVYVMMAPEKPLDHIQPFIWFCNYPFWA